MLSTEERVVLDFEGTWWIEGGPKDQLIELRLGLSSADYYEYLLTLIERPAAIDYAPMTVRRLLATIEPTSGPMAGVG